MCWVQAVNAQVEAPEFEVRARKLSVESPVVGSLPAKLEGNFPQAPARTAPCAVAPKVVPQTSELDAEALVSEMGVPECEVETFAARWVFASSATDGNVDRDQPAYTTRAEVRLGPSERVIVTSIPQAPDYKHTAHNCTQYTRGGTRTRNLLLRREAPYPLGHTSKC